jgi:hypothetical protein
MLDLAMEGVRASGYGVISDDPLRPRSPGPTVPASRRTPRCRRPPCLRCGRLRAEQRPRHGRAVGLDHAAPRSRQGKGRVAASHPSDQVARLMRPTTFASSAPATEVRHLIAPLTALTASNSRLPRRDLCLRVRRVRAARPARPGPSEPARRRGGAVSCPSSRRAPRARFARSPSARPSAGLPRSAPFARCLR